MKRWLVTTLGVLLCSAALGADVTIVQTTTVEGGMAAMAAQAGGGMSPKLTSRLKGLKLRTDVETGPVTMVTILDLTSKQMIILRPDQKTATVVSAVPPALPAGGAAAPPVPVAKVDGSLTPTGKSQVIDGVKCDEYTFTSRMNMGEMTGRQVPPEAAAMMQGVTMLMNGSIWVAKDVPGASEYMAFQKSAASGEMATAAMSASGVSIPGMEKLMKAMAEMQGLTYLTEMTINIEGTGQFADMMKQMGAMKVTNKVNSITTEALSDDLFKVPEGYQVIKQ
ncbi:MAG TPA: hypothetical protein VFK57_10650 [Vicinamibacterales bacterium]|nr:hypothetical protein [Vicinamibacterales bacterium]